MSKVKKIVDTLQGAISEQTKKAESTAYDTPATVRRVEGDTAWVHIPGGVDETPVKLTIAASVGDTVQVRVSGGRAFLVGNGTAPPTDDTTAIAARTVANKAQATAQAAEQTAREAMSKISGDNNQYAWHTETGTDTGTHITEVPKEDFIADPENGGGNSVFRSNGMAIRDGLTELATFGADHAQIGQSDSSNVYISPAGGIDFYGEQGVKIGSIGRTTAVQRTLRVDDSAPYDPSSPWDYYYAQCNIDAVPLNNEITITASVTRYRQSESAPITVTVQYVNGTTDYTFKDGGGNDFGATLRLIVDATNSGYVGFKFRDTSGNNNLVAAEAIVTYTNVYIPTRCLFGGELANPDYGDYSVSMNYSRAAGDYQTTAGKFNEIDDESKYAFIIGNGTKDTYAERNNAFTVDWNGNIKAAGDVEDSAGNTLSAVAVNDIISLKPSGNITRSGTGDSRVTSYTTIASNGSKLTNNGGVKIGSGVSLVKVCYGLAINTTGTNHTLNAQLYKNSTQQSMYGFDTKQAQSGRGAIAFPPTLMSVSSGDVIDIGWYGQTGDTLYANGTTLTVEVVK